MTEAPAHTDLSFLFFSKLADDFNILRWVEWVLFPLSQTGVKCLGITCWAQEILASATPGPEGVGENIQFNKQRQKQLGSRGAKLAH